MPPLAHTPFALTTRFPMSHQCGDQTNRVPCEIGRTANLRQSAAKLDVLSRSSSPLAIRYGVAHLLSCAATSMIDRGRRLTDEAFRTRIGKLSAGSSGCLFHVLAPVWHSGALLRASNRRGRASRVDSCRNPNRSWATIQAIFCVSDLCKAHDGSLAERLVTGSPKAHAAHQIDRDMGSRPQAQLLKKVLPPHLLARRRAPQQSCFRGRAAGPHQ